MHASNVLCVILLSCITAVIAVHPLNYIRHKPSASIEQNNNHLLLVETHAQVKNPAVKHIDILDAADNSLIKKIDVNDNSIKAWTEFIDKASIKIKVVKGDAHNEDSFNVKKDADAAVVLATNTASAKHDLDAGKPVTFVISTAAGAYSLELIIVSKFKPYTLGFELETKTASINIQLLQTDDLRKFGSLGKHKVASTATTVDGHPYLILVPDCISGNQGCVEIVSAPLKVGFSNKDQYAKEILKLRKAMKMLVDAAITKTNAKRPDQFTLFDEILVEYNSKIDEDASLANYKLPAVAEVVTQNLKQFKFYVKGKVGNVPEDSRFPQMNYDYPLASLSTTNAVQDRSNPLNFADMFTAEHYDGIKAVQSMATDLVSSLVDAPEAKPYKLTGLTSLQKKELAGAFVAFIHEAVSLGRQQCLVFGADVSLWIQGHAAVGIQQPSYARLARNRVFRATREGLPLWMAQAARSDSGVGKNSRDQLIKACVEKIVEELPQATIRDKLLAWWNSADSKTKLSQLLTTYVGHNKAIKRNAVQGVSPVSLGQLDVDEPPFWDVPIGECGAWLEAEIEAKELTPVNANEFEGKADASFRWFVLDAMTKHGKNIFAPEVGVESCFIGTAPTSKISPKKRGKENKEITLVIEMREAHPLDKFNAWAEENTWEATINKWIQFFKAQSAAAHA